MSKNLSDQNKLNLKKLESEKKTLEKNIYSLKSKILKRVDDVKKHKNESDNT